MVVVFWWWWYFGGGGCGGGSGGGGGSSSNLVVVHLQLQYSYEMCINKANAKIVFQIAYTTKLQPVISFFLSLSVKNIFIRRSRPTSARLVCGMFKWCSLGASRISRPAAINLYPVTITINFSLFSYCKAIIHTVSKTRHQHLNSLCITYIIYIFSSCKKHHKTVAPSVSVPNSTKEHRRGALLTSLSKDMSP